MDEGYLVRRWDQLGHGENIVECPIGNYVHVEDYASLKAAVSAFIKRYDELKPEVDGVFTSWAVHGGKWPEDHNWKRELDALRKLADG